LANASTVLSLTIGIIDSTKTIFEGNSLYGNRLGSFAERYSSATDEVQQPRFACWFKGTICMQALFLSIAFIAALII
jgi:hypothetical protein